MIYVYGMTKSSREQKSLSYDGSLIWISLMKSASVYFVPRAPNRVFARPIYSIFSGGVGTALFADVTGPLTCCWSMASAESPARRPVGAWRHRPREVG